MVLKLEDLKPESQVKGIIGKETVKIISSQMMGECCQVIVRDSEGNTSEQLLFRDQESNLEQISGGRKWSFKGDGGKFKLALEAERIRLAYLFDPYVAISSSDIDPLPHQISAVYEHMLNQQPMRFLLADDPGAGKTIMAGLLIKELIIRGDLERCLIISPGSLTEQWQDELKEKFDLQFDLLTRDLINSTGLGNPFDEKSFLIARMDMLSRNEELQERILKSQEYDLVVIDESHRMSAKYFGGEVRTTRRYDLGKRIGNHTRNLLLMTATPHNGIEDDFQLFMSLLDEDRFAGMQRDAVHRSDPSDLMRRLVKEDLYTFEGKKLFPERKSYTAEYELTRNEKILYERVTEYVREEMNRAERNVEQEGGGRRRVNVGFALMTLQRRLASSPFAIYKSIERRRDKLTSRLKEEKLLLEGRSANQELLIKPNIRNISDLEIEDIYEDGDANDIEEQENEFLDNATTAKTLAELEIEIETLNELSSLSKKVVHSANDAKWNELDRILNDPLMIDSNGSQRKLVIFTEFKDTLYDLSKKIKNRLGRDESVVEIHGSVPRDKRREVVNAFMNNPDVVVLLANDAAGEGVNLQRSHLMVNYDLPWNPNRLEQRFGRIHRIGQKEVCHLWNLLAKDTREGDVYIQLLQKLEIAREALGDRVFDVLGKLFSGKTLKEFLVDAIRYNDNPKVKERLEKIDETISSDHLKELLEERALVKQDIDTTKVLSLKQDIDRAMARRIQPFFVKNFFLSAIHEIGGRISPRDKERFEIKYLPPALINKDNQIGIGLPIQTKYERICFEKDKVGISPRGELITPGHPLLEASISLIKERNGYVLNQGTVLIDPQDYDTEPRLLFFLEHGIKDGRKNRHGQEQLISNRLQFIEIDKFKKVSVGGSAPYLDYRPLETEELTFIESIFKEDWIAEDWEQFITNQALQNLVPEHLKEIKNERLLKIEKARNEIKARLQFEINFWSMRYEELKMQESANRRGRIPSKLAKERAELAVNRLGKRMADLDAEMDIKAKLPIIKGGALIVPIGYLNQAKGKTINASADAEERKKVELLAMQSVMNAERELGRIPKDVSEKKGIGYDIESKDINGNLFFIEVKGRIDGASSITLTYNERHCAKNCPDQFRLAVSIIKNGVATKPKYISNVNWGTPGFASESENYNLSKILVEGRSPH